MPTIPIYQVDAFTDEPFKGNPAGVCITPAPFDDRLMQSIALEMHLSETAFAVPEASVPIRECSAFGLRWFTPLVEVDLCGHATLATAKVLFDVYRLPAATLDFHTRSGTLTVTRDTQGFCLDFPADTVVSTTIPDGLPQALGIPTVAECAVSRRRRMLLIRLDDKNVLTALKPHFGRLVEFEQAYGNHGFIVTAEAGGEFDFVSRYFAPGVGIDEDPVTGSAHTVLGPYWGQRLGKDRLRACQVSSRSGILSVVLRGERVHLIGNAVLTIEGKLTI